MCSLSLEGRGLGRGWIITTFVPLPPGEEVNEKQGVCLKKWY